MKTLKKNGYNIAYDVFGDISNPCIVFLHPAFLDHESFYNQIEFFRLEFCVVVLDMIGHGRSVMTKTNDRLDQTAYHVNEILESLDIKQAHFVGASMGSLMVQNIGDIFPDMVLSMTIIGGYNIHHDNTEILKEQRKEMFKWFMKIIFNFKGFQKYIAEVSVYKEREKVRALISSRRYKRKGIQALSGMGKVFIRKEDLNVRKYLVVGEHDLEISKKAAHNWHTHDNTTQYEIFKDAGHCVHMDVGDVFNEKLLAFIKEK